MFSTRPRSRRRTAALALCIAMLAASCGNDGEPEDFNTETEENFVNACLEVNTDDGDTANASGNTQRFCDCAYGEIIDTMTFDEFKSLDDDLDAKAGDSITNLDQLDLPPNDKYVDALTTCNNPDEAE